MFDVNKTIDQLKEELVDYAEVPVKDFKLILTTPDGTTKDLTWGTLMKNYLKHGDVLNIRKRKIAKK